jgi:hypothetical protein
MPMGTHKKQNLPSGIKNVVKKLLSSSNKI